MSPDPKTPLWSFNPGPLLSIAAILLSGVVGLTLFVARLDGHEYQIQALERPPVGQAAMPGRAIGLETRLDIVQAALAQPKLTSNRTRDTVQAIPADIAVLQAGRGN